MPDDHDKDRLGPYYAKRTADQTPEPFGDSAARPKIFVVQKHWARRLHYDFRMEIDGLLESWAIPHAPSFDPAIKRLAVKVEAHPLNYANFEGVIPEGNYGAGSMIVWDRGTWQPIEDPAKGFEEGKLKFELFGYKLRGAWTLVRTKGDPNQWLMIKKTDAWAAAEGTRKVGPESVLSGLTVEDLRDSKKKILGIEAELEESGIPKGVVEPSEQKVMLAETAEEPFSKPGWVFELKYDGFRLLASKREGVVKLFYRSGIDATNVYPDVVRCLKALPYERFLIDAEVVVLDDDGKPNIHRLQQRVQLQRSVDIERAAALHPATLYVFDLLTFSDFDLRKRPLVERKAFLQKLLPSVGPLRYSDHIDTRGEDFYHQVEKMGLEGVMAKRSDSPYRGGRSADWKKMPCQKTSDFVIVGYTLPDKITRTGFRNLHLAHYVDDELVHVGKVGSGFSESELESMLQKLVPYESEERHFSGNVEKSRGGEQWVWLEPHLVAEIRYLSISPSGHLRFPVFLQLRVDKTADDLRDEVSPPPPIEPPPAPEYTEEDAMALRQVPFTNLQKVFWKEAGYTKGDLIDYYREVSPWLLPYLIDRPVVLTRFPDGIDGKNFYQKDAPPFVPGWVRTERMWSQHSQREIDYFVCDNLESLLYLINMGSIPLHVWCSRAADLQRPDWSLIDLDPKEASFADVITVAKAVRVLCEEIGLPSYVKTTGSSGLHILVPLGGLCTYQQSRTLAQLIGHVITNQLPEISTMTRHIGSRGKRVYIDWLQNRHGQLMAAPFSVRAKPGAPISMVLDWDEVKEGLGPRDFNIKNGVERMKARDFDPMVEVLERKPDLGAVLDALKRIVQEGGG